MHAAVELLIKRMESNPEEFIKGHKRHHKWERIFERYTDYLPPKDKETLKVKYSELQLDQMHKDVMAELLYGDEKPNDPLGDDPAELARMNAELMTAFNQAKMKQQIKPGQMVDVGYNPVTRMLDPKPTILDTVKGIFK